MMAEVGDVNFCLKIQNKGDKIWNFHKKFLSLQRQNVCFDYAAECGEQGLNDTAPFEYKSCTIHDAAFLMLVFFTELPVKHRALGVISAYGNRFLTFEQENFNRVSIKLKI
jgi:hypothetical protein